MQEKYQQIAYENKYIGSNVAFEKAREQTTVL